VVALVAVAYRCAGRSAVVGLLVAARTAVAATSGWLSGSEFAVAVFLLPWLVGWMAARPLPRCIAWQVKAWVWRLAGIAVVVSILLLLALAWRVRSQALGAKGLLGQCMVALLLCWGVRWLLLMQNPDAA
jgi:hypothetical protein